MAFRSEEAASDGLAEAHGYLIPRGFSPELRARAKEVFLEVVERCGPAVDGYPTWHPLLAGNKTRNPITWPDRDCGYYGLDHTRYFAHGFVTCPYGDGSEVIESVQALNLDIPARISAEVLDCKFYHEGTTPVLVHCDWYHELEESYTVPKRVAVALMIGHELPNWRHAEVGETWETMRRYLLGSPHGSRSSLFVTQETALAMKKVFNAMNDAGVFGPVYGRE